MLTKRTGIFSELQQSHHGMRHTLAAMRAASESLLRSIDKTQTVIADSRRTIREANELLRKSRFESRPPL
jgi:hypothetical protein